MSHLPKVDSATVPVFLPTTEGVSGVIIGEASIRSGTMVVEFKDSFPGVAIQRMIARGSIMGMSFVVISEDDTNKQAQETLAAEEAELAEEDNKENN